MNRHLTHGKAIVLKKYSLDDLQREIFWQGFNKGYESSYMQIKEANESSRSNRE